MSGFEFEKGKFYLMPAHFRGVDFEERRFVENKVEDMLPGDQALSFEIFCPVDAEAVSAYLPPGFSVIEPAMVTVAYTRSPAMTHCGGRTLNTVMVDVGARFDGEEDHLTGRFSLVIWENEAYWIPAGREVAGAPKMFAEIPEIWSKDGAFGFSVSEHGRVLLEAEIRNLERIPDDHLQEMVEAQAESYSNWMGWKCIPSIVPGEFDANYPTLFSAEFEVSEGWAGEGRVRFFEATETQAPQSHQISSALAKLLPTGDGTGMMARSAHTRMDSTKFRRLK